MKNIVLIALIAVSFASCKPEKEKLTEKINRSEKNLMNDSTQTIDRKNAQEMIDLYSEYANKFKEDTMSAEYLFRAGDVANGTGQYKKAIDCYRQSSEVPGYSKQPVAFFLQGFIYETQLNDMQNAKRLYEEFLQKYPEHNLANDVKFSLDNLGKSPEELIKMFEQKDSLALEEDYQPIKSAQ